MPTSNVSDQTLFTPKETPMRNMPISMRGSPMVSGARPSAHAAWRVVFSRNPDSLPRLNQAVDAHRARNRDNEDWLKRDR